MFSWLFVFPRSYGSRSYTGTPIKRLEFSWRVSCVLHCEIVYFEILLPWYEVIQEMARVSSWARVASILTHQYSTVPYIRSHVTPMPSQRRGIPTMPWRNPCYHASITDAIVFRPFITSSIQAIKKICMHCMHCLRIRSTTLTNSVPCLVVFLSKLKAQFYCHMHTGHRHGTYATTRQYYWLRLWVWVWCWNCAWTWTFSFLFGRQDAPFQLLSYLLFASSICHLPMHISIISSSCKNLLNTDLVRLKYFIEN